MWTLFSWLIVLARVTPFVRAFVVESRAQTASFQPSVPSSTTQPLWRRQIAQQQQQQWQLHQTPADDNWETAEYDLNEPIPSPLENFLKRQFPEFFYLLQKNEQVIKVIQESAADSTTNNNGITLFAPSSQAFEALGAKRLAQLDDERNLETAAKMAAFHVVDRSAVASVRLFTEDWTQGRPKNKGEKPAFTVQGINTMGGSVPISRRGSAKDRGDVLGWIVSGDETGTGSGVIGTNGAQIVKSYVSKQQKQGNGQPSWIVHEMSGLISPELLWRYCDQLRIPGF